MCVKSQENADVVLFLLFKQAENCEMTEQKEMYRPYLAMAVFCEKVLRETDNVMSIVRVIDRFNIVGGTAEMAPTVLQFMVLISFKAGFLRGKQMLVIRPQSPDKKDLPQMAFPILFEGDDDRGSALMAQINFVVTQEGLYWFDVHLNEELVTRMPLRVNYQQGGPIMASG